MDGPTVVLVHGSFHGGWCFAPLVAALATRGVAAVAVDLPSHASSVLPRPGLHADAAAVQQVLDACAGQVVLVGHSYGGSVITEAGVHPAVVHLVYLCALMPDGHESASDVLAPEAELADEGGPRPRPRITDGATYDKNGLMSIAPEVAARAFYGDCSPETVSWALPRLRPQPLGWVEDRPHAVAWRVRPSTYVVGADDLTIHPDLQRGWAKRCTRSVELSTGHSPFLSAIDRVSDLLVEIGRDAVAPV
ncbi:alpha/beta hydrolase [Jatrophihabitans cynanchi]|uniref:Alpha/beta hydrolase n=1 Tax=Jatrophihabitans cynanchi TaxID=2944128 RepID=A0ABY7K3G7_9ACTN|nr:alpha/beta hydrolase [Jatrophihabitans sp. SB3-54]WAX58453.1 alpha/beta hydrolase [Jatrophihabitans sp. SB3-54]